MNTTHRDARTTPEDILNLRSWTRFFIPESAPVSLSEKLRGASAAFIAIFVVGLTSSEVVGASGIPLLVASMGASALLLFAVPHSPMAQPWPVLGGHILSALVGVTCSQWIPDIVLASAVGVALSILLMHMLHCLHPPGAATTMLAVVGGAKVHALGYHFLLTPVALNVGVLLPMAIIANNLLPGRRYPSALFAPKVQTHQHHNPQPLERLGISQDDLQAVLNDLDSYLDVSRDDLNYIYNQAGMHAFRRKLGEITCKDIMSRELTTAEFATELEEVWQQLHFHKVKAIPVIDRARRVIGIVTVVDFLKRANLKTHETLRDRLLAFIRRTPGLTSEKPEVVGQIMTTEVLIAQEDMHIVELVPLLSDQGLHHIPVVDKENRLVGMVTQSDLIAALFRGQVAANA